MKYTSIYTSVENATKSMLKHCENVLNGANVSYKTATIYRMAYQHAIDDIKTLPAADVEEVIRCKECKYFNLNKWGKVNDTPLIMAHEICDFWGNGCKTNSDAYCSFAERGIK